MIRRQTIKFLCTAAILLAGFCSLRAENLPDAAGVEFFEKKIRPILVDNCYKCHSSEAEKVKGGLLLDTRDGLLKGGDTGAAITLGDAEKSLLIKAVRYTDDELKMPPSKGGGKKLSTEQIADLETWVKMGAPDPRVAKTNILSSADSIREKASKHWAFQPIKQPAIPAVKNKRLVQTPIDSFILAKLDERGMKPSPQADKRTLIRRAYFDLTGLPPKPEEVEAFIADKSSDAFAKVVDRLLASPQYGERWGRHWLDVARYADTKGYVFEEERRYPYSYTYRDYVIRSFNEDLPFDQFIIQQLAADMLPLGDDKRPLAALGYLTLGRRFVNNIHDIIDDRIDVVSRGFMGLTVSCARCHDHKFDFIPTKDYYSLYGVFASSHEPDEKPLLGVKPAGKLYDEYLAEKQKRIETKKSFRENKETEWLNKLRKESGEYLLASYQTQFPTNKDDIDKFAHSQKLEPMVLRRWVTSLETWSKQTNSIFGAWFEFAALPETNFTAKAKEISKSLKGKANINPAVAKAFATNAPVSMKDVAETYGKLFVRVNKQWRELTTPPTNLTEKFSPPTAMTDAASEELRLVLFASGAPPNLTSGEIEPLFNVAMSSRVRELQRQIDELDATHSGAPPRSMALLDNTSPANSHVFLRGNPGNPGVEASRGFLQLLAGTNRPAFTNGSGRLELARAIASPTNPLTARVLVNRVWQNHFGAPMVRTPSDFGVRSDPPANPELLDHLAAQFIADGWSLKKLHRLIMLSYTYQQSSEDNPANAKSDPNNQFLWRMNRYRLDFEGMRDALLAVAGNLDMTAGGQPIELTSVPFSARRTVYGYIDRQNLPGVFRTFDFASPDATSPQRFSTTVPQQALFLMNSPFVIQEAQRLVERPEFKQLRGDEERIRFLYELAYQRAPKSDDVIIGKSFLRNHSVKSVRPETATWLYGYGEYDENKKCVQEFHKLEHFSANRWQAGDKFPDEKLGHVFLSAEGGHPGNNHSRATIRRWVAPYDGIISIAGKMSHPADQGDGVQSWIVSSRSGELGHWIAFHGNVETSVASVAIKKGDTIDFVTDCQAAAAYDTFQWSQVIKLVKPEKKTGSVTQWESREQFSGPKEEPKSLSVWEEYAQVLLLSNEFFFVD